jgi:uncharacterized LabA/DUF88 family protein
MFTPKTGRIKALAGKFPYVEADLETIFGGPTVMYVDYGNVRNWCNKLGWHVDIVRLKQLVDSFSGPVLSRFYYGTQEGVEESEERIRCANNAGYSVWTKPVKTIKLSIDVRGITFDSPDIIKNFVFPQLLKTFSLEMVANLNAHLKSLNETGVYCFSDLKCNFDVEIGRDMLVDSVVGAEVEGVAEFKTFVLLSCDSDFADPVSHLLDNGKKVVVIGVSGMVARELNQLRADGLQVYDVRKLKEMICWSRELSEELRKL